MKINVNNIKLPIEHKEEDLLRAVSKQLKTPVSGLDEFRIKKRSIDARNKDNIRYVYSVECDIKDDKHIAQRIKGNIYKASDVIYRLPEKNRDRRPVIVGAGPAGLFCAYICSMAGLNPIVLERGPRIDKRRQDVEEFWKTGTLRPDSNVQFGEGGAGTFSDGKLNTLVNDKEGRCAYVLETFVKFGAPANILYDSKPHVGTDILAGVIANMRDFLIGRGVEFKFDTRLTDISLSNGALCGIQYTDGTGTYETGADCLVLAIGHSARDTFELLDKSGVDLTPKPFAVGVRIEHPRRFIDVSQYGEQGADMLPAAPYKLTAKAGERGVYTFCMCPGGYVVNASSEEGMIAVNGMSYSGRSGNNSNSAVIVTVTPSDFNGNDALSGVSFQRELERRAYEAGNGKVPVQTLLDYSEGCKVQLPEYDGHFADFEPCIKGGSAYGDVHKILPEELSTAVALGIVGFDRHIHGFASPEAYVSGIESRTSSPVRIERDSGGESISARGIYPCGEGAGYAGGITSAAMDGMYIAEKIVSG